MDLPYNLKGICLLANFKQIITMADTGLNVFVNGVASYLSSVIFPSIVQGLLAKGVNVTVEELMAMTNTPAIKTSTTPHMPAPAVPSVAFGGAVPPITSSVAPTNNRKPAPTSAAPVAGRTCSYQYKRGVNKDQFCGKGVAPGSQFCNSCLRSRKNIGGGAGSGVPGVAPGVGAIPGMAGLPSGYNASSAATNPPSPSATGSFSVVAYDESRNLYKDPQNGFIVTQVREGVIAVIGYLLEAENRIVPLTEQQKLVAQNLGLQLADTKQSSNQSAVTIPQIPAAAPSIPQIPTAAPSIPQIPTAVPSTVAPQVPAAIPSLPQQIPTVNKDALPQIPTVTSFPSVPPLSGAQSLPSIPDIPQLNM